MKKTMICILCGGAIHTEYDFSNGTPTAVGFTCKSCGEHWTEGFKLFDKWAVRHIRILEQRVQTLESLCSTILAELKEIKEAITDAQKT
jgi:hypothetical protein